MHQYLAQKSKIYSQWHETRHHQLVHWFVFALVVAGFSIILFNATFNIDQTNINIDYRPAKAQAQVCTYPDYNTRHQDWLNRNGAGINGQYDTKELYSGKSYILAWLEKGPPYPISPETIEHAIVILETDKTQAGSQAGLIMMRALLQYPTEMKSMTCDNGVIINNCYDYVINSMNKFVRQDTITSRCGGTADKDAIRYATQPQRTVIAYLYTSLFDPSAEFTLGSSYRDWIGAPSGNSYFVGGTYNSLEYTKDILLNCMNNWVYDGNYEFDGTYTRLVSHSMALLYDFAPDLVFKNRAQMILDFMLLEQGMDFAGGHYSGTMGRNRIGSYLRDDYYLLADHMYALTGVLPDEGRSRDGTFYASTYRPPDIILEMLHIECEPDNYWHIHKENNGISNLPGDTGKWTYVTKNFGLGMAESSTQYWQLTIRTDDYPNHVFKLWLDKRAITGDFNYLNSIGLPGEYYKGGINTAYQYRNALFLRQSDANHLHVARSNYPLDRFDSGTENNIVPYTSTDCGGSTCENDYRLVSGGWNFLYKENDSGNHVAIAINVDSTVAAIEVATIGVDYPSLSAFQTAVNSNNILNSSFFTTSKGDVIGRGAVGGTINGSPIWTNEFPFDRMETEYGYGDNPATGKLIDWHNDIMTVSKNGKTCVYNFSDKTNWYIEPGGDCSRTGGGGGSTPTCTCTAWQNQGCHQVGCASDEMLQTRTCTPTGCSILTTNCVFDAGCSTSPPVPKTADLNCDNIVNMHDLGILISCWNNLVPGCATTLCAAKTTDISGPDGLVNISDFGIMLSQWG